MAESKVAGVFSSADEIIRKAADTASGESFIVVSRDGAEADKLKEITGLQVEMVKHSPSNDGPVFRNLATAFEQDGEDPALSSVLGRLSDLGMSDLDAREVLGYAEDGLLVLLRTN
ncbi:hypothetical protein ACQCVH_12780 [Bacillus infantis]|uniref:hypothetical protein n=1 Tax=Bacillus infantis TaxID=324767 RepID=UPI003CFAF0B9